MVECTDYTTDGPNSCANVAQELEDLGRPTLETNPDALWREFENVSKQLKHGGYMESTLPSGETDVLHFPGYKRSEEHGWVYGNHPKATEQQNAHFQDTLVSNVGRPKPSNSCATFAHELGPSVVYSVHSTTNCGSLRWP